ncbi:unnamed protein product [Alopecurus aequalis]
MAPRKKRKSAPPASIADRIDALPDLIGALPDCILHHVLSFVPAQAAVQTCVLARRWRHLWRSTTGLRIDGDEHPDFLHLQRFVEYLLLLRERTDLDTVEIKLGNKGDDDNVEHYVKLWIRFAVMCKARVFNLYNSVYDICLANLPLVSRNLRTLDLRGVILRENFLNFASCPALEDLKMANCDILDSKVSSRSLKHLDITDCSSKLDYRFRVSTLGLLSLKIAGLEGKTPFLENMALLETAYVELDEDCEDFCLNYDSGAHCEDDNNACENCVPNDDDCSSDCVLLGGISSAKHLKLLSESRMFIFRRDLRHCPITTGELIFAVKLKTLLLNEYWCAAPDLDPLACILKNAPVLEKLTLQLFSKGPNHKMEMKGSYSSTERSSAISEHLNIVEVKCNVVDKKIFKVLKFMSSFNIRFSFE